MWDWMASTPNLTPDYQVNDGSAIRYNCTDTNHDQWSYNYGTMIMGSAYMYTIVSPPLIHSPASHSGRQTATGNTNGKPAWTA
jgi:hypothetical protein